jgi:hypothetical protein
MMMLDEARVDGAVEAFRSCSYWDRSTHIWLPNEDFWPTAGVMVPIVGLVR